MKRLIVFDLDGTLAESKSPIDAEMAKLMRRLLGATKAAVISGGAWHQFHQQFLSHLHARKDLHQLSILPTCGTQFFQYDHGWNKLYSEDIPAPDREMIKKALKDAFDHSGIKPHKLWGEQIEDRGSQITFSGLGQSAPLDEKEKWDPDFAKRKKMKALMDSKLKAYSVNIGGSTSIDITAKGIDKAYGIRKLRDILRVPVEDMLYLGDALFKGGNDFAVKRTGIETIAVRDPEETKHVIEGVIASVP